MSGPWWVSDKDLDSDQILAIQGMEEDDSFLIRGPAGSGKTNILLLRAKWFQLKGKTEYRIVVFTRSLCDFIRGGSSEYGIPPENVVTSVQLFTRILAENGISTDKTGNFESDRLLLAGKMQSLIETKNLTNLFDALLIDETQDYSDTEIMIFRRLTSRLIMATDVRQSIYRTAQSPEVLEQAVGGKVVELKYHYRSGIKICRVADAILRDSMNYVPVQQNCMYNEKARPSSLELIECPNLESQFKEILERLPNQLDAYPDELIGVLFPKREQQTAFLAEFGRRGFGPEADRVRIDTMHGGKGLEFRAVHLGGSEALYRMGATQRRLIYTSILRGQTSVHIYYSGSVPGYVSSAVAQIMPPKPQPSMSELFRRPQ